SKEAFGEDRRTGWFAFAGRHRSCRSGLGLCRFEAGEQNQGVRHHRGPDVGLEVIEAAPGAAGQTVGSLEAGDPGLDPGAEVAQLAIDPAALDHVFARPAALFVKGDILDAARLGRCEIVLAGITAIGGELPRRHAATGDLAFEHRQEALGIGGVAGLDDDIQDQAARAGDQVELVSVLHVAATPWLRRGKLLRMMSVCGSNRLTSFSLAGTAWPARTP